MVDEQRPNATHLVRVPHCLSANRTTRLQLSSLEWSAARKHAARHTEKESTTADIDVIFATAFCANGHLADERRQWSTQPKATFKNGPLN